jgi:hypothetical protein
MTTMTATTAAPTNEAQVTSKVKSPSFEHDRAI